MTEKFNIDNLPIITFVKKKSENRYNYSVTTPGKISKGYLDVFVARDKLISINILTSCNGEGIAEIDAEDISTVSINTPYPFLDGYWGEKAALVLNASICWKLTEFHTSDGMLSGDFLTPYKRHCQNLKEPQKNVLSPIVPDRWDHEHCFICNSVICDKKCHSSKGYVTQDDIWVCEQCYSNYIQKKCLNFIRD